MIFNRIFQSLTPINSDHFCYIIDSKNIIDQLNERFSSSRIKAEISEASPENASNIYVLEFDSSERDQVVKLIERFASDIALSCE